MNDQSDQSHFQDLFEAAFRDYEKVTGKSLDNHPLAEKLQTCNSVESVAALLDLEISSELPGKDKVLKPVKNVLSVLHNFSSDPNLGLPLPPVKAIHTGLGILLSAVKDVLDDYDTLADLLDSVEQFLKRLDVYTQIPPSVSRTEIIIKILVELLSILALATKQLRQGKLTLVKKKLFGGKDIQAVLQRLDRLTEDEARLTAVQTLEVVHGLFKNMNDVVDDGKTLIDHVRDALEIIQQLASDTNKSKRYNLKEDIQSWLSPPDPWKNYHIARQSRQSGSAAWFLRGDTYSEWKRSDATGSLLWVHGKPGAGKSVFSSAIVEDIDAMRKAGLASLAFFYCDFREDQKKDLRGLLSSLLFQLCHQSDSYCDALSKFYSDHDNGSRYSGTDGLAGCLKDLLKLPGHAPVYLIVDALDECPDTSSIPSPRSEVLGLIEKLIKSEISNLHICVTSRPEMDIKDALDHLIFRSVSLHDERGQKADIEEYIQFVINTDPKNKRWKADDKRLVIDVLTRKAQGMFRWVYCQLLYICGCMPARIRHALDDLPETLYETYERTLREIKKADWEYAHRIFQFVAVAVRPLRVEELAELLAFDFDVGPIPKFRENWRPEDPIHAVLSTCHSFLIIVEDNHRQFYQSDVQFAHFSVKEFLASTHLAQASDIILRRYHISETPAHSLAAQACLGYLLHLDKDVTSDSLPKLPFTEYSAKYWDAHTQLENGSQNLKDGLKEIFNPSKPHLAICIWIRDKRHINDLRRGYGGPTRPAPLRGTPLHYAALWDLHFIVELLVNELSQDVNSHDYIGAATPLHVASINGHVKIVHRLLEYDADVKVQQADKGTPLHVASKIGHSEVVRMLIGRGASVSAQNKYDRTPLHEVFIGILNTVFARSGHAEVAHMLIERGANVMAQDTYRQTPLHLASLAGQPEGARMLIECGADVSAHNKDGRTPLHLASKAGQLEVTRMLIERGADVSAQDKDGQTPLHLASQERELETARMLIERGSDVSPRNKNGQTPLHLVFLETRDLYFGTPGHAEVVRMLIDHGADVSAQDKDSQTPLHLASRVGQLEGACMLIECGADLSAQDKDGQTTLHLVSQVGQLEVARMLIERGADVSTQDKDGQTPLHLASRERKLEIARMLIERGSGVSARDKNGQTPLHLVFLETQGLSFDTPGHAEEVVRMLIERGADVSAQDKDDQTSLHLASRAGQPEGARMLIERGADVSAQDKDGQTPLHLASRAGELEVARTLIEGGAGVSARENNGQTPLHLVFVENWYPKSHDPFDHSFDNPFDHSFDDPLEDTLLEDPFCHLRSETPRYPEVARLLVERGADVAAEDEDGRTPVYLASLVGQLEFIRALVHGADAPVQS